MDKNADKQMIIDEYLKGVSYRELEKKYEVSQPRINRWVLDYQGIASSRAIYMKGVILLPIKANELIEKKDGMPAELLELQR